MVQAVAVSCWKNGIYYLVIRQVFENWCHNLCYISFWIFYFRCTYNTPCANLNLRALQGLTYGILQTTTSYSESWHIHWDETKIKYLTKRVWGLLLSYSTFSQNSVLLCDQHHRGCTTQFSYLDANVALLLHFVLIKETPICHACHSEVFLWVDSNLAPFSSSSVSTYLPYVL